MTIFVSCFQIQKHHQNTPAHWIICWRRRSKSWHGSAIPSPRTLPCLHHSCSALTWETSSGKAEGSVTEPQSRTQVRCWLFLTALVFLELNLTFCLHSSDYFWWGEPKWLQQGRLCPWLVIEGFQTEQREHLAVTREKLRQYTSASSTVCKGVFWDMSAATWQKH